jgi:hypothetical protein
VIPFGQWTLAAVVATAADDVLVFYGYCQGGTVAGGWYYESLVDAVTPQSPGSPSVDTCMLTMMPTTADPSFVPFAGVPAGFQPIMRATVAGPKLQIQHGLGSAVFGADTWSVTAFAFVDCSQCGGGGWYEVHSLLERPPSVAFGIFYLLIPMPGQVGFDYGITFDPPGLLPANTAFPATTWMVQ